MRHVDMVIKLRKKPVIYYREHHAIDERFDSYRALRRDSLYNFAELEQYLRRQRAPPRWITSDRVALYTYIYIYNIIDVVATSFTSAGHINRWDRVMNYLRTFI
jgi:hypothetical protein